MTGAGKGDNRVRPDGAEIKRRRVEKGWSQETLAEKLDCSPNSVKRHEAGKACLVETLAAYAKVFGLADDIRPLLAAKLGEGEGLAAASADIPTAVAGTITGGDKLLAEMVAATLATLATLAGVTELRTELAEVRAELARLRLGDERRGSLEIEIVGPPRALELLRKAYEAGAFEHLGVKSFGVVYAPPVAEPQSEQPSTDLTGRERDGLVRANKAVVHKRMGRLDVRNSIALAVQCNVSHDTANKVMNGLGVFPSKLRKIG